MDDFDVIGGGVLCGGILFFLLGVMAFSRQFLLTGNICMIIGITIYLRPAKVIGYMSAKERVNGFGLFILGFILIILKLSFVGVIVELIGSYWLAGGILNIIVSILCLIPGVSLIIPSSLKYRNESLG